jgi:glycosyltransferase involved in cell wall biosynthesis
MFIQKVFSKNQTELIMVRKLYVVRSMLLSNSAVINRMMGHLRAFSEAGLQVEAAFIAPNANGDKMSEEIPGVNFHYCWGDSKIRNRYLKALLSYWWAWRYVKALPKGSDVLLLGADGYIGMFQCRKDLSLYYETTEHPALARNEKQLRAYVSQCKKFKHIFVISRPLRQFFLDSGISEERVTIVNMTVDPKRFDGIEKQTEKIRYIAYCGTVTNNKDGVDDLLRAFSITHRTHPNVKLYIIGATPDKEDRAGNMRLIEELGIKDCVIFTGVVEAKDMPQLLMNATVMALDRPDSLQAQNGFPTKLGEYLLTGNPVVVTKVGDIPKFLEDGKSALLSDDRNAEEFAKKLSWALDNPEQAWKIGSQGREIALREFDCVKEGNKLIKELL